MTVQTNTSHRNQTRGRTRRTGRMVAASAIALVLAIIASFALTGSIDAAAAASPRGATADESRTQTVETEPAQLPPAPLGISIGERPEEPPTGDFFIRPFPAPDDCPQGTIYHEGQCLEFVPPTDDCPQGTIEHNGECLEFEVPLCEQGYVLVGLECEKLVLEAIPVPTPAPVKPVVPTTPPVLDAPETPELSEDDCPQGTIYHEGQCLEFVPPSDDCPQGTIEHNGECLEFEVPECEQGYVLVGLECEKLVLEANLVEIDPVPAVPVLPEAKFRN